MPPSPGLPLPTAKAAAVAWETTRACDAACPACPLSATSRRDPHELSTIEAMLLMNRLRAAGYGRLSLTGADSARRPDLEDLVAHATRLGLETELTLPDGVPVPVARLGRLRKAGLARLVVRRCGEGRGDDGRAAGILADARAAGLAVRDGGPATSLPTISPTGEGAGPAFARA